MKRLHGVAFAFMMSSALAQDSVQEHYACISGKYHAFFEAHNQGEKAPDQEQFDILEEKLAFCNEHAAISVYEKVQNYREVEESYELTTFPKLSTLNSIVAGRLLLQEK